MNFFEVDRCVFSIGEQFLKSVLIFIVFFFFLTGGLPFIILLKGFLRWVLFNNKLFFF